MGGRKPGKRACAGPRLEALLNGVVRPVIMYNGTAFLVSLASSVLMMLHFYFLQKRLANRLPS